MKKITELTEENLERLFGQDEKLDGILIDKEHEEDNLTEMIQWAENNLQDEIMILDQAGRIWITAINPEDRLLIMMTWT